jgi:hypothetical protein
MIALEVLPPPFKNGALTKEHEVVTHTLSGHYSKQECVELMRTGFFCAVCTADLVPLATGMARLLSMDCL